MGTERKADRIDDLGTDGVLFDIETDEGTFKIVLPSLDGDEDSEPER